MAWLFIDAVWKEFNLFRKFVMKRQGLIYHFEWNSTAGEVVIAISRGVKIAYYTLRVAASSLIVAGVAGLIFTFQPIVATEISYRLSQARGESAEQVQEAQAVVAAVGDEGEKVQKFAQEVGITNTYFSIYIPKIGAKSTIIDNVDPVNEKAYLVALKQGVAHAAGSVFPGMEGATFLFAHSSEAGLRGTQFNTVFYLLRELEAPEGQVPGDEIYVFFLDKLYKYRVSAKHMVDGDDTHWLTEARTGSERLILQTCWPPGTAWKRLIIVADPVVEN